MITKIYVIMNVFMLVFFGLSCLFKIKHRKLKKESKCGKVINVFSRILFIVFILLYIAFYALSIYIYSNEYWGQLSKIALAYIIVMSIIPIIFILEIKAYYKYFEFLIRALEYTLCIIAVIGCILGEMFILFLLVSKDSPRIDDEKDYREYAYSIEIEEMNDIADAILFKRTYYIKSMGGIVYYYDVINENGESTRNVLEANKYCVKKDEDDKYINNPHIEVYEVGKRYTNMYKEEKEEFITYEYVICIPEKSIYYPR